ncbi:MAG: sensor histidine kinase [Cyclobacteriaceae bacterium]|jgi:signal transduction histidine kinase|nr:sensor histidine kinase [Cyclobacteriaceae bacterium]
MNCPSRKFLFCFVFVLISSAGLAQGNSIVLDEKVEKLRLDNHIQFFIDKSSALSFEDVSNSPHLFQSTQSRGLVFGYEKKPIWLKVILKNNTIDVKNWVLNIPAPFLEFVDFYQQHNTGWKEVKTGYYLPHNTRPRKYSGFALPIIFNEAGESTVYIKISGTSPKTFPVWVEKENTFDLSVKVDDIGYGLFFGILCSMFLYNLVIYFSLRLKTYLIYIGTLFCTILIFASASGYGGMFIWPNLPELNFIFGRLSLGFFAILLAYFAIEFLEVKRHYKWLFYYLIFLMVCGAIAFVLMITKTVPSIGNNLVALTASSLIITGILTKIKNQQSANFFIAAWSIYLVGGVMLTLRNAGLLAFNFWTTHLAEIGAACETVIIALALADRYKILKEEKEKAQKLALTIQEQANEKLETLVGERTEQLSAAVDELHATLKTNQLQTRVIEYKNAELDAFFYGVSHDLKSPLSSLINLTQLAKDEILDKESQYYFNLQLDQINRIDRVLKDLVLLAKLDHGNIPRQQINFDDVISGCLQSLRSLPGFHQVSFDIDVKPGIKYKAEWVFVNNILQNLIENAIKYCRDLNPCVWITIFSDGLSVVIKVKDNGIGIHSDYLTKIFDLFFRATHASSGSGLGLYILNKSVKRLGGNVYVESKEKIGSEFTVILPLDYEPFDPAKLFQE